MAYPVLTQNLTPENRSAGEAVLRKFFDFSDLSRAPYYPITNPNAMLNYYQSNFPTFIEYLGELSKKYSPLNVEIAMVHVGDKMREQNIFTYPLPSMFKIAFDELDPNYSSEIKPISTLSLLSTAVADTSKELATDAYSASKSLAEGAKSAFDFLGTYKKPIIIGLVAVAGIVILSKLDFGRKVTR